METLLSLPGIRITERWVTIADRRYAVTELENVRTMRGRHDVATVRAATCTAVAIVLLAITARSLPAAGLLGAVSSIVILAAITAIFAWRRPRGHALWADHHGIALQLYFSDDERIFGHVCRALRRARERAYDAQTPNAPHYGRTDAPSVPHPSTLHPATSGAEQARNIFSRAG
jgi:hypothetical protein